MSSLAPYGPQNLQNLTWSQIAVVLHDPSSAVAKSIDASANYLTAAFCKLTGNQPASACTPAMRTLESRLGQQRRDPAQFGEREPHRPKHDVWPVQAGLSPLGACHWRHAT